MALLVLPVKMAKHHVFRREILAESRVQFMVGFITIAMPAEAHIVKDPGHPGCARGGLRTLDPKMLRRHFYDDDYDDDDDDDDDNDDDENYDDDDGDEHDVFFFFLKEHGQCRDFFKAHALKSCPDKIGRNRRCGFQMKRSDKVTARRTANVHAADMTDGRLNVTVKAWLTARLAQVQINLFRFKVLRHHFHSCCHLSSRAYVRIGLWITDVKTNATRKSS